MLQCPPPTLPPPPAPVPAPVRRRAWWRVGPPPPHVLLFDELYAEPRARAVLDARGFARRAAYFHEIELTLAAAAPEGRAGQTSGWRWPSWRVRRLLLLTRDLGGRVGSREGAARYLPGN
jgi:hypothetical protein